MKTPNYKPLLKIEIKIGKPRVLNINVILVENLNLT